MHVAKKKQPDERN